jgi:hypothetical protein
VQNKKLTVDDKNELRNRLNNLNTNQLYIGPMFKVAADFKNSSDTFVEFLNKRRMSQRSQLSNNLKNVDPNISAALLVMSQWDSLKETTCQFLLK